MNRLFLIPYVLGLLLMGALYGLNFLIAALMFVVCEFTDWCGRIAMPKVKA